MLIKCPTCGKEVSDQAAACPVCGHPILEKSVLIEPVTSMNTQIVTVVKEKSVGATGRLTIGIVTLLITIFIIVQSFAVGALNAMEGNGAMSGTQGMLTAGCFVVAAIVGISTRNVQSKSGAMTAMVFYWLGALATLGSGETYADLPIWGGMGFCFGIFFLVCALKAKA